MTGGKDAWRTHAGRIARQPRWLGRRESRRAGEGRLKAGRHSSSALVMGSCVGLLQHCPPCTVVRVRSGARQLEAAPLADEVQLLGGSVVVDTAVGVPAFAARAGYWILGAGPLVAVLLVGRLLAGFCVECRYSNSGSGGRCPAADMARLLDTPWRPPLLLCLCYILSLQIAFHGIGAVQAVASGLHLRAGSSCSVLLSGGRWLGPLPDATAAIIPQSVL